ncbi:hypothetical protein M9434_000400 [Picochlorum sp. BPE23]|nr:hypothetical protein M9434_000400 [Picochlorum sp. BPE23]
MSSNWDLVPIGALEQIAECLGDDYSSLSNMRLVCTSWRDAVSSARICLCPRGYDDSPGAFVRPRVMDFSRRQFSPVMKSGYLDKFQKDSMRLLERCVLDNMQRIASLSALAPAMENCLLELSLQNSAVTDGMLLDVLPKLKLLRELDLQGCLYLRGECIRGLEYTRELQVLKLGACGMDLVGALDAWKAVMPTLKNLRMLNIMNNIVSDECIKELVGCTKLEYLDIRKCPDVTLYEGVYHLSRSLSRLETFKLGPLYHCSTDEIWQMIPRFKHVKALEIMGAVERHARPLTDVLETSIWHVPRLEKLSLMDSQFDWSTIKVLSISCGATLEYLNLSRSQKKNAFWWDQRLEHQDTTVAFPKLKVLKCNNNSDISLKFLNHLLAAAPSLEDLDLSGLCLAPSAKTTRRYLVSGYQTGSRQLKETYEFSRILGSLQHLEVLKLADTRLEDVHCTHLNQLGNLQIVDISKNAGVTDAPFDSGVRQWDNIKVLKLSGTQVSVNSFVAVGTVLEQLEELHISGTIQRLQEFCESIRSSPLKELHIEDCENLNDESLGIILSNCPEIKDLSLAGCCGLSPDGLLQVTMLPKLERLNLSRLHNALDDDTLQSIVSSNRSISELFLSGHENLSRDSLEFLLSSEMLQFVDISFCFGIGNDDQCTEIVTKRDSPIKIRLPQGTSRLGLAHARRSLSFE